MGVTYYRAPALKFSTLFRVLEVRTIKSHESCTRPTTSRCFPIALVFKVVKWG